MAININNFEPVSLMPGQRIIVDGDKAFPAGPVIIETLSDIDGDLIVDFSEEFIGSEQYRWYRLYKSGWVEQGGRFRGGSQDNPAWFTVELPVTMSDSDYYVFKTPRTSYGRAATMADLAVDNLIVNSIDIYCPCDDVSWSVYGQSAVKGE